MKIIKRNGTEVDYDGQRIMSAVKKANEEAPTDGRMSELQIMVVEENVRNKLTKSHHTATVEEIQDIVIHEIMRQQAFRVAQLYTEYRYKQMLVRKKSTTDDAILALIEYENEEIKQENSNKNPMIVSTQRDYIAGEVSKDLTWRVLLPPDIVKAHDEGILHFHDADYFLMHIHNCCFINMEDMLMNGTVISETKIDSPNSFGTACNVATQIVAQVASSQFGGQTFSLAHLVPFAEKSRQKQYRKIKERFDLVGIEYTEEQLRYIVEEQIKDEIKDGIQTIQYQLLTLMTTNGQTPFVSMYININDVPEGRMKDDFILMITEVFRQRIQGIKNEKGVWVTAAFPKILYVLDENNVKPDSEYIDMTILAAKCTAARMVPDYISAKIMREYTDGDVYGCMGCRSFLTKDRFTKVVGNIANAGNFDKYENHYWGRFNQGVVTINLVDVALSSHKDMDEFWKIFDERLELCHRALRCRHERLLGTPADVAPILWRYGALARLKKGEVIDKLLYNGYSTISLGYAGLYEMCYYMTGKSHTEPEGETFAIQVMQHMNDMTEKWKTMENIDYSLYGTPLESTTYRFAKCLHNRFGEIEGVTDHNYITNSYHEPKTWLNSLMNKLKRKSSEPVIAGCA